MSGVKDAIYQVGFVVLTVALGILYYLYDRRGKSLQKAVYDLQKQKLDSKLKTLKKRASKNEKDRKVSAKQYRDLVRRYKPLLNRLGVRYDLPGNGTK